MHFEQLFNEVFRPLTQFFLKNQEEIALLLLDFHTFKEYWLEIDSSKKYPRQRELFN